MDEPVSHLNLPAFQLGVPSQLGDRIASGAQKVAGAVTESAEPTPLPISVTVDRPFIFMIRDLATDANLFLGRIEQM